jgi:hypothetical protein
VLELRGARSKTKGERGKGDEAREGSNVSVGVIEEQWG